MAEFWSADLLDSQDRMLGRLPGVRSGSMEWSIFRAVWGSGTIEWTEPTESGIEWLSARIRIWHHSSTRRRPMGIWMPAIPSWEHEGHIRRASIALLDKSELLNQPIGRHLQVPAGTNPVTYTTAVLRQHGERHIGLTDTSETLASGMWFEPGDTWLKLCTDVLAAAAHEAPYVDMEGVWRAGPYVLPDQRPLVATYGGRRSLGDLQALTRFADEAPVFDVPNVVRLTTRGDEDTKGLYSEAVNADPNSPLSTVRRGRTIVHTEEVEATSQAALDALTQRRLSDLSQVTRRIPYTHPVDDTHLNDRVGFRALDESGPIVQRSLTMGVGACVTSTIRRIYTGGVSPWGT